MKTKYEIIAETVPTIRAMIAKELSDGGHTQQEIASALRVSQPAVSQYLRNIRGKKRADEKMQSSVKSLCERIQTGEMGADDINKEIYAICESLLP